MPRKGRKTTKRRTKGGFYSFSGSEGGIPGAAAWRSNSEMGEFSLSNRGGNAQFGARRRKNKKTKRRRMRGGGSYGQAVAGYVGTGARGLADGVDVSQPAGKASGGAFNNYGAQPGSGHGSVISTK